MYKSSGQDLATRGRRWVRQDAADAADRFRGAVIVVGTTDGDGARLQVSTAFMTLDRMFSLVAFDALTLPRHAHKTQLNSLHNDQHYCHVSVCQRQFICSLVFGRPNKNSSGEEIANVNFFTTISHTYLKIPKKRTYFA